MTWLSKLSSVVILALQMLSPFCSVVVHCYEHALEKASTIRQSLSRHISEALDHSPSLIILDDLDSLVSSTSDLDGIQPSTSTSTLSEFLADILDEYEVTFPDLLLTVG